MKIAIGSEHAGSAYAARLAAELRQRGHEVLEYGESGTMPGYPQIAERVCLELNDKRAELGILICGTGIGMCMAAGKMPGIRAALIADGYMAQMAKKHNNANVVVFGARVIGYEDMLFNLDVFLAEEYEGGRHDARLAALHELETKHMHGESEVS